MAAFDVDDLAALRPRIARFCYHMLGSPFDADDAAQDVMERAWRARHRFDPAVGSLMTWLLRIAHNVCVDRVRESRKRPLPHDLRPADARISAPLVAATDVSWLMPAPTGLSSVSPTEDHAIAAEALGIGVTAVLQALPPRQRGVFLLREVVGLSASEVAVALSMTVPAVNSALQRARRTMRAAPIPMRPLAGDRVRDYAAAIERGDVVALAELIADDVVFEMPPIASWTVGREPYTEFMTAFLAGGCDRLRAVIVEANGQAAILLSRADERGWVPHTLQLLSASVRDDGVIGHVLVFADPRVLGLFADDR